VLYYWRIQSFFYLGLFGFVLALIGFELGLFSPNVQLDLFS